MSVGKSLQVASLFTPAQAPSCIHAGATPPERGWRPHPQHHRRNHREKHCRSRLQCHPTWPDTLAAAMQLARFRRVFAHQSVQIRIFNHRSYFLSATARQDALEAPRRLSERRKNHIGLMSRPYAGPNTPVCCVISYIASNHPTTGMVVPRETALHLFPSNSRDAEWGEIRDHVTVQSGMASRPQGLKRCTGYLVGNMPLHIYATTTPCSCHFRLETVESYPIG